MSASYFGAL